MRIAPTSRAAAALRTLERARRRSALPVVLCIDVEPDDRILAEDEGGPWLGLERFLERIPAVRSRLAELTGGPVAFTWFLRMDPQVERVWGTAQWAAVEYAESLGHLVAEGDELGLHTHTWRWDPQEGTWFADFEDEQWAAHCVHTGLDAYEASFGRSCASHRGGDVFLSPAMIAALAERGVGVDLTVEPGRPPDPLPAEERHRGALPDHRGAPSQPFRSSPARFPAADGTGGPPTFIPHLTSPAPISRRAVHASSANFALRLAAGILPRRPRVLAIAVRTDTALRSWGTVAANLEHLARHRSIRFVTASAAAAQLAVSDIRG